jgi:nucleoside-diphosphate kinase
MAIERSFVMVKPDGVQRGLIGEVIARLERRGLKLIAAKFMTVSNELAEKHYAELKDRPFFPGLIKFITSGPVMAMVWEGPNAVATIRATMGATNPANAQPGTIRADFACDVSNNIVHGSDSPENGVREINLWFSPEELQSYSRTSETWLYPNQ